MSSSSISPGYGARQGRERSRWCRRDAWRTHLRVGFDLGGATVGRVTGSRRAGAAAASRAAHNCRTRYLHLRNRRVFWRPCASSVLLSLTPSLGPTPRFLVSRGRAVPALSFSAFVVCSLRVRAPWSAPAPGLQYRDPSPSVTVAAAAAVFVRFSLPTGCPLCLRRPGGAYRLPFAGYGRCGVSRARRRVPKLRLGAKWFFCGFWRAIGLAIAAVAPWSTALHAANSARSLLRFVARAHTPIFECLAKPAKAPWAAERNRPKMIEAAAYAT